jgi:tetratricopeptide (TPR) repeat protein
MKRALEIDEKAYGKSHPTVAKTLSNLAALYIDEGKFDDAAPLVERALDIASKSEDPDHPGMIESLMEVAEIFGQQNRFDLAIPVREQILKLEERNLGKESPELVVYIEDYADAIKRTGGDQDKYQELKERARALRSAK